MIAVDALAADGQQQVEWDVEMAQNWLDKMCELTERHRDLMVEF